MDATEEIVINDRQGKSVEGFGEMLAQAAAEIYRVLEPGAWCSVAFQNKDAAVWSAFSSAFARPGFALMRVVPQPPSAKSFTMTWSDGSPKTHVLVHLRKVLGRRAPQHASGPPISADALVSQSVSDLQAAGIARPSPQSVYDEVISRWLTATYGTDGGSPDADGDSFTLKEVGEALEELLTDGGHQ